MLTIMQKFVCKGARFFRGLLGMIFILIYQFDGDNKLPQKRCSKIYSVFSFPIRLKFMRKTIVGIITKEITIMLKIIVQFIPIINFDMI